MRLHRRKYRGHEMRQCFGIDDGIGDLLRLIGDELSPDRVTLRPEVFALVVEAFDVFVDDDAKRRAVEARHDAAVELRRARIERYGVATARIADWFRAVLEQLFQHASLIMLGAAGDKIVCCGAPT